MENFDIAQDALKTALGSEGSSAKELGKYQESIDAHLKKLKASWQAFSQTFLNSDFLKGTITGLTGLVDVLEKLVKTFGTLGTISLGAGIFGLFKSRGTGLKSGIVGALSSVVQVAGSASSSTDTLGRKFQYVGREAGNAGKSIFKSFSSSLSGAVAGIGLLTAAISLAINWYKNYREEISQARQETIQASDEFLNSTVSFEQAYAKYSGRTILTSEEESELASAIDGTVSALDDKSSALQNVVDGSSSYIQSLEQIAKAELEAANTAAKAKRDNAKLELEDTAFGWSRLDGSEVNIDLGVDGEDLKIAEEMNSKFLNNMGVTRRNQDIMGLGLSSDADAAEIVEYYSELLKYQELLSDAELTDTNAYEQVSSAIDALADSVGVYTDGLYDAAKAQYQLQNGIPTTVDEFLKMRESILQSDDIKGLSFDAKKTIAGSLDSDFGSVFDLTDIRTQARQLIGIINSFGDKEASQMEMFLNMRTAVNNNECTVGDYMSQFADIENMTKDWSEAEKEEFNLSFGIDTDTIKEQYDTLLTDLSNVYGEKQAKNFLDGLSASELSAAFSMKAELDWEGSSPDEILKYIEQEAERIEAISFTISIDAETEKLEGLTSAISESMSAVGLGAESMSLVKDMFGDLDSYDPSKLFERTANGIRLNADELRKLNDEYSKTNIADLDKKMSALGDEYNQTREELYSLAYGTDEYNAKLRDLNNIEDNINALEELQTQYEGLTSAYNQWQQAESAGSQRDMYESVIEGLETVEDEISRGWYDDGTTEFLELLTGKNLTTASIEEIKEAWKSVGETIEGTNYSISDFFTVNEDGESTNTGVYNFLRAVEDVTGKVDVIKRNSEGAITGFDFNLYGGDEAIAEALGVSEELVQIMIRAADDAGFVVSMDGTFQQLDVLKQKAAEAAKSLKDTFKVTDYDFFQDGSAEGIAKDYQEALSVWETFKKNKNEDGTINMNVEGAEEAFTLVSTLQSMVDQLGEPVYMELSVSEVEKEMQTPLTKLQEFERLTQTEHQLKLKGTDTSAIEADKEKILDYFEDASVEVKTSLGIPENATREEIAAMIENEEIQIPATVDLQVEMNQTMKDMVNVALYQAGIIDDKELEARVDVSVYANDVDTSDVEEKTEEAVNKTSGGEKSKVEKEVELEVTVDEYRELLQDFENADKDVVIDVTVEGLDKFKELSESIDEVNQNIDLTSKINGSVENLSEYVDNAKELNELDDTIVSYVTANIDGNIGENKKTIDNLEEFAKGAKALEDVKSSNVSVSVGLEGSLGTGWTLGQLEEFADGAKALQDIPNNTDKQVEVNLDGVIGTGWTLSQIPEFAESAKKLQDLPDKVDKTVSVDLDGVIGTGWTLDQIPRFAENAKLLKDLPDKIDKSVEVDLSGNVGTGFTVDKLPAFADGINALKDVPDKTDKTVSVELNGNLGANASLDKLEEFAKGAKSLKDADSLDVVVNAELNANLGFNGSLDELETFAKGAKSLEGAESKDIVINAELNANLGSNMSLDELENFAKGAKSLDGVESVDIIVNAKLNANLGFNGSLNKLSEFAKGAEELQDIDNVDVVVNASLDSDGLNDDVGKLKDFADGAKSLKDIGEVSTTVNATLNANTNSNMSLDELETFAKGAKSLDGVESQDIAIDAYLNANLGFNGSLDELETFAKGAKSLSGVESANVTVSANLDANLGLNMSLDELETFAKGAKSLDGVESVDVTVSAKIDSNLGLNMSVDELENFAKGAKALKDVDNVDVSVKAKLDGNLWLNGSLDKLSALADGAKSLKDVDNVNVSVDATLDGNLGNNNNLDKLKEFADNAKLLDGVKSVDVTVTANLDGSLGTGIMLGQMPSFVQAAKDLNGIGSSEISVTTTAKIGGNLTEDGITKLEEFNSVATALSSTSSVTVSVNANIATDSINSAISLLTGLNNSGVFKDYNATVIVKANLDATEIDNYNAPDKDGKVKYDVDSSKVDDWSAPAKTGTVTYSPIVNSLTYNQLNKTGTITYNAKISGFPIATGTAHASGTTSGRAFVRGNWGIKGNGVALGGRILPPILGDKYKNNLSNCWKSVKAIKLQHKDETSLNVNVTKVEKIGCMAYGVSLSV